jgi:hypothetical protein
MALENMIAALSRRSIVFPREVAKKGAHCKQMSDVNK